MYTGLYASLVISCFIQCCLSHKSSCLVFRHHVQSSRAPHTCNNISLLAWTTVCMTVSLAAAHSALPLLSCRHENFRRCGSRVRTYSCVHVHNIHDVCLHVYSTFTTSYMQIARAYKTETLLKRQLRILWNLQDSFRIFYSMVVQWYRTQNMRFFLAFFYTFWWRFTRTHVL